MSLHALAILIILFSCFVLSLSRHPFWGLLGYVFLYFNIPNPVINWWAVELPELRWSFWAAGIVIVSIFIHKDQLNNIDLFESLNYRLLLALTLLMLAISLFAAFPQKSFERWYDFFRYAVCFVFFIKCIPNMSKFEILIWVCLLCCLNLSWEAYIHPEYRQAGRLEGIGTPDSADSNLFATVLMMSVPYIITEMLFAPKYRKVAAVVVGVFVLNAIVLCGSRGSLVGLAAMALVFLLFETDRQVRKKILIGTVVIAIVFIRLFDPTFIQRLVKTEQGEDSTGSGRLVIWSIGLEMAKDHPFGAGGYAFEYLSPQYMPRQLLTKTGRRAPHNTYLLLLVEQGALGLVLFLFFWWVTIRMLHVIRKKIATRAPPPKTELFKVKLYALSTEAAIIGILVSSFFVDRLYFELLYLLAGMATFLYFYGVRLLTLGEDFA